MAIDADLLNEADCLLKASILACPGSAERGALRAAAEGRMLRALDQLATRPHRSDTTPAECPRCQAFALRVLLC